MNLETWQIQYNISTDRRRRRYIGILSSPSLDKYRFKRWKDKAWYWYYLCWIAQLQQHGAPWGCIYWFLDVIVMHWNAMRSYSSYRMQKNMKPDIFLSQSGVSPFRRSFDIICSKQEVWFHNILEHGMWY